MHSRVWTWTKKKYIFYAHTHISVCFHICILTTCITRAPRSQKRTSDPGALDLPSGCWELNQSHIQVFSLWFISLILEMLSFKGLGSWSHGSEFVLCIHKALDSVSRRKKNMIWKCSNKKVKNLDKLVLGEVPKIQKRTLNPPLYTDPGYSVLVYM